ncbi:MAG: protein-disulfide isomerase [Yoonia sp.]|jgi:protein-disulfide isomerase
MLRRNVIAGGVAVAGLGAWALTRPAGNLPVDPLMAANAQTADVDPSSIMDMVQGSADAPVEIVEYASFTCPHCATFHANVYPQLKAEYIDTGKVRFVYREVYFDRYGLWASMIARCGGEMRFFGIADLIYEKQRDWTASGDPATIVDALRTLAKTAGMTDAMLDECLDDAEKAQNLVGWYQANAERDDVRSTPSFLIDGEKYSNMSLAEFKTVLDEKIGG